MIVFEEYLSIRAMSLLKNYRIIAMSSRLNMYMYDLLRRKFLTGVVNVPNILSVLYEYKSGTVNGLNNKYGYGNSCLSETGFSRECLDTSVGCKSELQFIRQMAHRSAH